MHEPDLRDNPAPNIWTKSSAEERRERRVSVPVEKKNERQGGRIWRGALQKYHHFLLMNREKGGGIRGSKVHANSRGQNLITMNYQNRGLGDKKFEGSGKNSIITVTN